MLEEIRAFNFPWGIGANLTNVMCGLQVTDRVGRSTANMDHAARGLDKSSFSNVMAGFFLIDH